MVSYYYSAVGKQLHFYFQRPPSADAYPRVRRHLDMATDSQPIEQDLAIALTMARGGQRAEDIARELFQRDCHVLELDSLMADGERAVYYEGAVWTLRYVPIETDGENILSPETAEQIGDRNAFEAFVAENGEDWAWIHPRYRWLIDRRSR